MEAKYYMEYKESKKAIEEMFDAYYKLKNSKRWGIFKSPDIQEKVREKTEERYREIRKISRKERTIKAEFFEDHFVCTTGDVIQEYQYGEIEALYETNTTLVFVAGRNRKKEAFVGLKKGSVRGRSLADLKTFLLERCIKVTKGIEPL
ncbi:MAG: hypothetical protein Q4C52_06560 [Eubacteriales bacterium]|nr:hypothetical protein [Eubacteriales bacterium]